MPTPENQVEHIVREVLVRLGGNPSTALETKPTTGELELDDAVISAATVAKRLIGVQRLIVSPRAVVTPAARDLLKEHNVTLVRALRSAAPSTVRVALATADGRFDASGVVQSLRQHGIDVEQLTAVGVAQVAEELAEEVGKSGKLGVLITDKIATALCVANRHRGVRAATAANRGEVNEITQNIGANLLVVDPVRRSCFEVQRIVEAFCLAGPRKCPAELKNWLE